MMGFAGLGSYSAVNTHQRFAGQHLVQFTQNDSSKEGNVSPSDCARCVPLSTSASATLTHIDRSLPRSCFHDSVPGTIRTFHHVTATIRIRVSAVFLLLVIPSSTAQETFFLIRSVATRREAGSFCLRVASSGRKQEISRCTAWHLKNTTSTTSRIEDVITLVQLPLPPPTEEITQRSVIYGRASAICTSCTMIWTHSRLRRDLLLHRGSAEQDMQPSAQASRSC